MGTDKAHGADLIRGRLRVFLAGEHNWLTPEQAAGYLALPSRKALYQAVRRGLVQATDSADC